VAVNHFSDTAQESLKTFAYEKHKYPHSHTKLNTCTSSGHLAGSKEMSNFPTAGIFFVYFIFAYCPLFFTFRAVIFVETE
jgi:hypothetical protein